MRYSVYPFDFERVQCVVCQRLGPECGSVTRVLSFVLDGPVGLQVDRRRCAGFGTGYSGDTGTYRSRR